MIIRFYRLLLGYLQLRFYGDSKEKLLSACAQNGIAIWGTKLNENHIEVYITISDFKLLRTVAPKGSRVHILKKSGLPFITSIYRKRWGIAAGAVLFFAILQLLSGYIWIIDVNGNHKVKEGEILTACRNIGITEGIRADSIYPKAEREKLLLQLDGAAWAAINIEGSRLTVNLTESKENSAQKSYSNLKSTADGIITKIDVVSGTSVVSVGQAVKKGDLLVSGIIETADGTRFAPSKGTIFASVEEKVTLTEDYVQRVTYPKGKQKCKMVLQLFGLKIPLYLGSEAGEFEADSKEKTVELFGNRLPIKIYEKTFSFTKSKDVKYSYEALVKKLDNRLAEELKAKEDFKVTDKKYTKTKIGVRLTVAVKGETNIEYEDILLISAGN